jgi:hypothetical protein
MIKIISFMLLFAVSANAQVLTTAETIGEGKQLVAVSENHLYEGDVDLNIAYAMYVRGVTPRLDLFTAVGETHIFGEGQAWVGVGGNAKLFSVDKVSVSTFAMVSVPLHRFAESSTVLANPAVVVSRPINSKLSLYSGLNMLIPIGARARGLFTPPSNKLNVPLGASIALGNWGLVAEVDAGKLRAIGIMVSRMF